MPTTARRRPSAVRSWATREHVARHGAEGRRGRGQGLRPGEVERRDPKELALRPDHQVVDVVRSRRTLLGCRQGLERNAVGGRAAPSGCGWRPPPSPAPPPAVRRRPADPTGPDAPGRGGRGPHAPEAGPPSGPPARPSPQAPTSCTPVSRPRLPRPPTSVSRTATGRCRVAKTGSARSSARLSRAAGAGGSASGEVGGDEGGVRGAGVGRLDVAVRPGRSADLDGADEAPGDQARRGRRP